MAAMYVYCPTCSSQIPARLECQGTIVAAHRGLYFQRCPRFQYFRWVDPPSVQEPKGDAFPRDPTIRSPSPASPQIDPSLFAEPTEQLPAYSDSLVDAAPAGPSPSLPSTTAKRMCNHCSQRQATAKNCSYSFCKQCCQANNKGCAYARHRVSTPTNAANGNPSALSRPPAVVPLSSTSSTPTTSTSASTLALDGPATPTSTLPSKIYSKPMDAAWEAQYKAGLAVQQRKKEEEEGKRAEARRLQNEVQICFFSQDDEDPDLLREQDLPSLPYFNLSKSLTLLRKMKLAADDEIGLYDFAMGLWRREDVDTTVRIVPGQALLVRRAGVVRCASFDRILAAHAPARKSGKLASIPSSKRREHERDPSNRILQAPRTTGRDPRHPRSPSPTLSVASSSPFPSVQTFVAHTLVDLTHSPAFVAVFPSISLAIPECGGGIDTGDSLWARGRVLVPTGFGSWPAGIYARDMAWAFAKISIGRKAGSDVESRFRSVFLGVEYVKPTYQRQLQHWRASTQAERDTASNMPRDSTGLWNTWRQASSGQQKFDEKQGSKGKGSKRR
ncbi:hypothetical protein B0H14DRAFT_3605331 [Mycena olivaceomarginata]|nr:hypothetical protein B0H14DRAFT_3605331 [Mycena olivaceomarginata]